MATLTPWFGDLPRPGGGWGVAGKVGRLGRGGRGGGGGGEGRRGRGRSVIDDSGSSEGG